jgi:CDP-diacylglycerol--serine O-phosphatidyltransferase
MIPSQKDKILQNRNCKRNFYDLCRMFNIPNILTAMNLMFGSLSILFALQGRLDLACYLLIIAMVFDFADGFVARAMKISGEFGKQMDSLADMVSFGVAPGIIAFVLLIISGAVSLNGSLSEVLVEPRMGASVKRLIDEYFFCLLNGPQAHHIAPFHGWTLILPFLALLIPFFSLFRLAKFNLDQTQADYFKGLATPANTLFFMSVAIVFWFGYGQEGYKALLAEILIRERILSSFVVIFSFLLIAEFPLIALKFKTYDFKSNWEKYILVITAIPLIAFLGWFALPFIVLLYLVISVIRYYIK